MATDRSGEWMFEKALAFLRGQQDLGLRTSPVRSLSRVFQTNSRDQIKGILASVDGGRVSFAIDHYVRTLNPENRGSFIDNWSRLFVGVLMNRLNDTPGNGWKLDWFIGDYNEAVRGTPMPPLITEAVRGNVPDQHKPLFTDSYQSGWITDSLIREQRLGYFFENPRNFDGLYPPRRIVKNIQMNSSYNRFCQRVWLLRLV